MYFFKAILSLVNCSIAKVIVTFFIKKKAIFNYAEITQHR